MDRGIHPVRLFAHHERTFSELEVRDSGFDCGIFLWVDVEADGVDFCVGASARGSGHIVALFVSNHLEIAEL